MLKAKGFPRQHYPQQKVPSVNLLMPAVPSSQKIAQAQENIGELCKVCNASVKKWIFETSCYAATCEPRHFKERSHQGTFFQPNLLGFSPHQSSPVTNCTSSLSVPGRAPSAKQELQTVWFGRCTEYWHMPAKCEQSQRLTLLLLDN